MKVYINEYRNHWISPYRIMEKVIFWREIDYDEPFIEKCNTVLEPFCKALQSFLNFIHPEIRYVKIDKKDTWSMDHTLAYIILPMLKQLKETSHGSPFVDDEDVPDELKSKTKKKKSNRPQLVDVHSIDMHEDGLIHQRWKYVLDEMIWAFEQKIVDDVEDQFFDYSECGDKMPWLENYVGPKVNWVGLEVHRKRMDNAFRLFGKYYQNLWD